MKKGTYLVIILFRKDNETVVAVNRMSHSHDYVFRNAAFKNDFSVGATVDEVKKQEYSKMYFSTCRKCDNAGRVLRPPFLAACAWPLRVRQRM